MASSRLPGFLRRSLRISYDDDDDDDDDENADENDDNKEEEVETGGSHFRGQSSQQATNPSQTALSININADGQDTNSSTGVPPHPTAVSTNLARSSSTSGGVPPPVVLTAPPKERILRDPSDSISSSSVLIELSLSKNPGVADAADTNHDSWQEVLASSNPTTSSATATSDELQPPKPTWREVQMQKCLDADVVSLVELRKLAWNGIPNRRDRALAWKLLLGYAPTNRIRRDSALARKRSEYLNTVAAQHYHANDDSRTAQDQETLRQVLVDVPRTAPDIPLFRHDRIKRMLSRLLYSWAMRHPASSYVQGINDLATPLIVVFLGSYFDGDDVLDGHVMHHLSDDKLDELEADVYWCLTNLLSGIQDHYTADQPGVQRMVKRLEELTNRIDQSLCQHLRSEGVEFLQFSFKWMNCLLLREFHLRCIPRLWDTYLAERSGFEDFHVYVCAAFLCQFSSDLQTMPFDRLFGFFQEMPTGSWTDTEVEMLLSQAYVLSTLFGGSDAHLANTSVP